MAPIFSPLVKNVGIDIGTNTTRVFAEGRGMVLSEPSIVATDTKRKAIIAVGNEAELLIRRSPDMAEAMTPFQDGVIADYRVTRTMIQHFIRKSVGKSLVRTRIMLSVPYGITEVEKRAMTDAILQLGSREAHLVEAPVLAAMGEKLPVFEAVGNFVIDVGAGTTDVAMIAMGGIVRGHSARIGGNDLNKAILRYIRDHFNVMVAEQLVEDIKLALATAVEPTSEEDEQYVFKGRDMFNGLSKQMAIRKSEVYAILFEPIGKMVEVARSILEQISPELASDVIDQGILLTGGTTKMQGFAQRIATELGVPVRTPEESENAVVYGFESAFKEKDRMNRLFISSRNRKGRI